MANSHQTPLLKLSYPDPNDPLADGADDIGRLAGQLEAWGSGVVSAGRAIPNMNIGAADPSKPWVMVCTNAGGATSDQNGLLVFTFAPFVAVAGVFMMTYNPYPANSPLIILALHNAGHDGGTGRITLRTYKSSDGIPAPGQMVNACVVAVLQRR